MKYLLDTNVISELRSKQPDAHVVTWIDNLDPPAAYLSVITIGEIRKGAEQLPPSRRREELLAWLTGDLLARFSGRILTLDVAAVLTWGELTGRLARTGRPLPALDSLIAALALHHGCTLATRNTDDFIGTGVPVYNPWQPEP